MGHFDGCAHKFINSSRKTNLIKNRTNVYKLYINCNLHFHLLFPMGLI